MELTTKFTKISKAGKPYKERVSAFVGKKAVGEVFNLRRDLDGDFAILRAQGDEETAHPARASTLRSARIQAMRLNLESIAEDDALSQKA